MIISSALVSSHVSIGLQPPAPTHRASHTPPPPLPYTARIVFYLSVFVPENAASTSLLFSFQEASTLNHPKWLGTTLKHMLQARLMSHLFVRQHPQFSLPRQEGRRRNAVLPGSGRIVSITDCVVVTANYRLGALCFLVTADVRGNFGIQVGTPLCFFALDLTEGAPWPLTQVITCLPGPAAVVAVGSEQYSQL